MLKIIINTPHTNAYYDEWTLDSSVRPFHPKFYTPTMGPLLVIADGPELGWIKQHFTGIPMVSAARQVRWQGDVAAFIVNNVPCVSGGYGLNHERCD